MKIATWNLQRGGSESVRRAQNEALRALSADVVALTEPSPSFRQGDGVVASPALRKNASGVESWVAIVGASVEPIDFDIPYERMAVAARASVGGTRVILYCAVLPWLAVTNHAPDVVRPGEDSLAAFTRVLAEQCADVAELRNRFGDLVVWAGDFNQTLVGPLWGGSEARRALLEKALASIGYVAWNDAAAHAKPEMHAVDLICGPADCSVAAQGRIDPRRDGVVMSDHAGYWVDLTKSG
jgi:endonuclease/exonuclease/phosphatase family metal-dependent hydrolase